MEKWKIPEWTNYKMFQNQKGAFSIPQKCNFPEESFIFE
jgi:hypothetical protein